MLKVKKSVTHQGIGGKEFIPDEYATKDLHEKGLVMLALQGNIACINFINRRPDDDYEINDLMYGHVGNLGYIVSKDELEEK